ncbi:hybrid sensor histidine kinase/response regulator [Archangium lipolyticum]|uniref:hybrid sensor histidine kinase/response regulator n=1 Tax=Archangium lipolyticum TaxID=2970465 RepID=UPI00214A31A5|nr:ATP-binding protein [Archangium lipolyticum]
MDATASPAELFSHLVRLLPEPLLLVTAGGRVVDSSPSARELLGLQASMLHGRPLAEFTEEAPERVGDYLRICARTTEPLPGGFTLKPRSGKGGRRGCHGARLGLAGESREPWVFLRFSTELGGSAAFGLLGQKVDELTREVSRRRQVEEALRASESRLRRIVDSNIVGVFFWRLDGGITYANEAFLQMVGYSQEELEAGRLNWREFTPPEYAGSDTLQVELLVQSGRHPPYEKVYLHADGHRVPILLASATFIDSPLEGVAFVLDLTARKRAEEHLRLLADASTALSTSLHFPAAVDRLLQVLVPRFADWCGVFMLEGDGSPGLMASHHVDTSQARVMRSIFERYLPSLDAPHGVGTVLRTGRSELLSRLTDEILGRVARGAEHLALLREGAPCSGIALPLRSGGRVLGALLLLSLDPSRLYGPQDLLVAEEVVRRASLALENARLFEAAQTERQRAEEANRLKDDFLSTVSHELRTPLTSMLGWLQMLRRGILTPEKQARALEVLERNTRHQTQLVGDLLDVSRILTGKMRLELEPVVLSEVVGAALDSVRPAAEARGIRLLPALDPDVGPVRGDAMRLQQVVWNLVQNAVKFTPSGGQVEVLLESRDAQAVITVSDTGQGIAPDFLPHLFERFRQADSSTTRQHGGLGLGLSIVKHLVEMHGGSVKAHSEGQGRGATFTVRLPLQAQPLACLGESSPPESQGTSVPSNLSGRHILLVDDEADTREMLQGVLESWGLRVSIAASATEGLEVLKRARPDVLVSDIGMPGEDGYSFIQKVRQLPPEAGGRTPAVALTAFARNEDRRRVLLAGFTMHVPKPVEPTELLIILGNITGQPAFS